MVKPSVELVGVDAERAKARHQRRDAIAFLHAQLAGAADRDLAAVRREGRDRGQLVDEAGHFLRRDVDRTGASPSTTIVPRGSPASVRGRLDVDPRAEAAQHVEQRRARRIQADILDVDARARQGGGGDQPERGRREVAGNGSVWPVPRWPPATETVRPST